MREEACGVVEALAMGRWLASGSAQRAGARRVKGQLMFRKERFRVPKRVCNVLLAPGRAGVRVRFHWPAACKRLAGRLCFFTSAGEYLTSFMSFVLLTASKAACFATSATFADATSSETALTSTPFKPLPFFDGAIMES